MPGRAEGGFPRWALWVVVGVLIVLIGVMASQNSNDSNSISYTEFKAEVAEGNVESIEYDNTNAKIEGVLIGADGQEESFTTTGFSPFPDEDLQLVNDAGVEVTPKTPGSNIFVSMLSLFLPLMLIIAFFVWISRRQQSQMGGIMSIGRSKAKTYSTERPGTTFDDVAGYAAVKKEVTEVVDFLKDPTKFAEIGARIPKGVLLRRASRHRQDPDRPSDRRRSRCAVHVGDRFGLHGDVRRCRRQPSP